MANDGRQRHDGRWSWLVQPADPDAPAEDWPDGKQAFRGILLAVPLSGLLW